MIRLLTKKLRDFWKLGVLWETCSLGVNFKLMSSIVFNVSAVKFLLKNRFLDLWFVRVQLLTKFQVSFKLQYSGSLPWETIYCDLLTFGNLLFSSARELAFIC